MKKLALSILILVLTLSLATPPAWAQTIQAANPPAIGLAEHVPGELLIRFSPGLTSDQAAKKMSEMGLTHKHEISALGVHVVKLPPGLSVEQALSRFNNLPAVDFAEPNYILHIAATPQAEIVDQWGLSKIQTIEAWGALAPDQKKTVLLATVDSGIDRDQPDLSSRIWINHGEIPDNGIDDDNNTYIDDYWGWDFVNNDNEPLDDNMHGTAVSSVMVAVDDADDAGIVGICPWCEVMAVKVINNQGSGTLDVVAKGVVYAADEGVKVINLSLGAGAGAQTLEDAVNYAWNKGAVVVAAAGNNGTGTPLYPAGYANAMAVASTDENDRHSCFSNYGDGYISVAAPGEAIYVIDINDTTTGYNYYSGTSLSTPHVSGLAGLLLGKDPNLTNTRVREIIENSAVDLGASGIDGVFGYGRVDAYRAVTEDFSQTAPPDSLFSTDGTATGFSHSRKLVRDSSGRLHLIWHTTDNSLYRIRYATSDDNGQSWDLQPDVYSSPYETYHPALAADDDYLYVAFPGKTGTNLPYRTFFTRKPISGGSWSSPDAIISGNFNAVRPTIYVDPSNGRLHVIASSYDDSPNLYYRASSNQGNSWGKLSQFSASNTTSNLTIYAALYAYGDNIYVVARTVETFFIFSYLNVFTVRSINGGSTWIDQTQISAHLAFSSTQYGISLAGVGDRVYMGYEVGTSLYFRRNDGNGWSDYMTLDTGDANNIYKWPSITQAPDGQAWMVFELNSQLYMRHYNGSTWQPKESISQGTYPNLKLGTSDDRIEWVSTTCNGSPFDLAYDWRGLSANNPPQADDQNISTNEDTSLTISLTGSDADNDPLTFNVVTPPQHGELSGTAPNLTYTPASNYNGSDSFTFVANDGKTNSAPATVYITINPVNDQPVAITSSVILPEDTPVNITLSGSDPDGDSLSFQVVAGSGPAHGSLTGIAPNLLYTPNPNYHGSDSFNFKVNDGKVDSAQATVSITVNPVNDLPVANPSSITTPEDTPVGITLTGSDADNDPLTFNVVTPPQHGELSGTAPNLTYTPAGNYNGSDSFNFIVNDGKVDSAQAAVSITVNPVNDTPTNIALSNSTVDEHLPINSVVGSLTASDPDAGDTFTFSLGCAVPGADDSSFNISGTDLLTSAVFDFATKASYSICLRVTDQGGLTFDKSFIITVTNVNTAPTDIALSTAAVDENLPVNTVVGTLSASDPNFGNTFTFSLACATSGADDGAFNILGSNLRTSAAFDFETKSSYSICLHVADQGGLTFDKNFTISVNNINEAPTGISLSNTSVNENQPTNTVVGALSATDPDAGATFTFSLTCAVPGANDGAFNINGTDLRTSASFDFETKSSYNICLHVTDQGGLTFDKNFTISVNDVNEAQGIHVGDLDAGVTLKPRDRWDASVTITVHDTADNPIAGVTAAGTWTEGTKGNSSCITNNSGQCTVSKTGLRGTTSVRFTITSMSHDNLAYDSNANHDPDADSNGTTILVYRDGPPANNPPLATFTYNCTDLTCNFDASASADVEGSISSFTWDLGDGSNSSTSKTNHTYNKEGAYTVALTVVDDQGVSSSHSWKIFLGDIPRLHVADLDASAKPGNGNHWGALVKIFVLNDSAEPLAGVTVTGSWSSGSAGSCITDLEGWCTVTLSNIKTATPSLSFRVTDLSAPGWEFDYQENTDPDGESDGTLIFVDLGQIYLPLIVQRK